MTNLPETEEVEKELEDFREDPGVPQGQWSRLSVFLAGAAAALLCVSVFQLGKLAARWQMYGPGGGSKQANAGAEILTDKKTLSKLEEIQALIEENYFGEVDSELLSTCLFKGAAAGLEDLYANYYSEEELKSVLDASRGGYFGIGATLMFDVETGEHIVVEVYEESPSAKGGLEAGDVLLSVDGTALAGMSLNEAVSMIKSKTGEFVVEVYRADTDETLPLMLSCDEIELDYVEARMLDNQIGLVEISEFTQLAAEQFQDALKTLDGQGMEKLIVDLRGNPGGLLDAVCDMLDDILPESLIVYTEDKKGNREEYHTDDSQVVSCETAVLVDRYSASASEIFAGAVQDLDIGPVIGETTYGKGVVQNTYFLSDGSAIKFTSQKYFTPDGQDIDGNGITPDIIVETPEEETAEDQPADDVPEEGTAEGQPADDAEQDAVLQKAIEVLSQESVRY